MNHFDEKTQLLSIYPDFDPRSFKKITLRDFRNKFDHPEMCILVPQILVMSTNLRQWIQMSDGQVYEYSGIGSTRYLGRSEMKYPEPLFALGNFGLSVDGALLMKVAKPWAPYFPDPNTTTLTFATIPTENILHVLAHKNKFIILNNDYTLQELLCSPFDIEKTRRSNIENRFPHPITLFTFTTEKKYGQSKECDHYAVLFCEDGQYGYRLLEWMSVLDKNVAKTNICIVATKFTPINLHVDGSIRMKSAAKV